LAVSSVAEQIRVVLFDVGGVLVEFGGVEAIQNWRKGELAPTDIWRIWLRSPSVRAFETGRMDADAFAKAIVRELAVDISPAFFLEAFANWPRALFPGALKLLARIPRRFRRALLSNSNALHWPRVMNDMALGGAVDQVFVSHLTGKIKPDDEAFEHAIEALDCSPKGILFLDDNPLNVEAAERLGMHAIVVRGTAEAEHALVQAGIFDA
jgi:glucose-1-phosphatase